MKKYVLLVLFFVLQLYSNAQEEFEITNFQDKTTPISPTAAALGSYGSSPISLASGSLNLSIPIWEIKGTSLSLPISFAYRPGVRIEETSAYTGHGWSLFAGGVITRNVIGEIDPHPRMALDDPLTYPEAMSVISHVYDAAPDIFNYNFNGQTGQFALKNDLQTPHYINDQRNWKTDFDFNNNIITIIIENGTQYVFAETETTSLEIEGGLVIDHDAITAWYLSEIVSAQTNEKIVFTYYNEQFTHPILENNSLQIDPFAKTATFVPESDKVVDFKSKKLKGITLYMDGIPVQKVDFESNTLRHDITGTGYALSRISIYDDVQNSVPLKYFDIDIDNINNERLFLQSIQEFSGDGSASKPPYEFTYINPTGLPGRLEYKADHWGYYSSTTGTEFPYSEKFKWRFDKTKEPTSTAEYGSLKKIKFPTGGENSFDYGLNKYHKEDWNYTTDELELTWNNSLNRWVTNHGTPNNELTTTFSSTVDQIAKVDVCLLLDKASGSNYSILRDEVENYEISIKDVTSGQTIFIVTFDGNGDPDEIDMIVHSNAYLTSDEFENIDSDPQTNLGIINYNSGYIGQYGSSTTYAYNTYNDFPGTYGECIDRTLYLYLPAGTYLASVKTSSIDNAMLNGSKANMTLSYHTGTRINSKVNAGGLRIEEQHITAPNVEEQSIYYTYDIHDENGNPTNKSSGNITDKPMDVLLTPVLKNLVPPYTYKDRYTIYSKPKDIHNSYVVYSEVKVTNDDVDINGFKIHKFGAVVSEFSYYVILETVHDGVINPHGEGPEFQLPFPYNKRSFSLNLLTNALLSKPLSTLTYKYNNTTPKLVQEENYDYFINYQDRLYTARLDAHDSPTESSTAFTFLSRLNEEYSLLKSKETKSYNPTTNDYVSTKVAYEYNNSDHYLPTKITTTDSRGEKLIKKTKYTPDYLGNTVVGSGSSITLQTLQEHNIFGPVEEQIWKGTDTKGYYLIDGKLTIYDEVSSSGATTKLFQPIEIATLEIDSDTGNSATTNDFNSSVNFSTVNWVSGVSYLNYAPDVNLLYNELGILKDVSKVNGIDVSYIWGYDMQYPIAKIENAAYSQVSAFVSNLQTLSDADDSVAAENTLRSALNDLRNETVLADAMITTYTYDPLIGVTSITDPKGYTTYYEYDAFNRLEYVKDADGNIINKNKYNYKKE